MVIFCFPVFFFFFFFSYIEENFIFNIAFVFNDVFVLSGYLFPWINSICLIEEVSCNFVLFVLSWYLLAGVKFMPIRRSLYFLWWFWCTGGRWERENCKFFLEYWGWKFLELIIWPFPTQNKFYYCAAPEWWQPFYIPSPDGYMLGGGIVTFQRIQNGFRRILQVMIFFRKISLFSRTKQRTV